MRFFYAIVILVSLIQPAYTQQPSVRSGPMAGYGEMTETMLWVQTTAAATVQYRYWIEGEKGNAHLSKRVSTTDESDFIAKVVLPNLKPGTRYEYELLVNGKASPRPYRLTFITQTFWQWRSDPPDFTVAFGSCMFINDAPSDRPGKPYGGDYHIFNAITEKKPDLMLWLGDNWYYREDDSFAPSHMRNRVARDRSTPELQPLLGSTHHYAIWDDHDFGPDNSDRTYAMRSDALDIFRQYWANPTFGTLETQGVFFRFMWGDVEFFMLDDRFYRSPNRMPADAAKTMFGASQLRWLEESLVSSNARFKIVVNGNQILAGKDIETLRNYPGEFDELIGWIMSQKIPGVLFLSGDRHLAELSVLEDSTFYPLYDFTSSPLTAGLSSRSDPGRNPLLVPGTFVSNARNFGILRFEGKNEARKVTLELYDANGTRRWSHVVRAVDLMPPANDAVRKESEK